MSELTVIFGAGAIGMPVARALAARGDDVRIAQRSAPRDLPRGVAFMPCDILDRDAVRCRAGGRNPGAVRGGIHLRLARLAHRLARGHDPRGRGMRGGRRTPGLHRQPLSAGTAGYAAPGRHAPDHARRQAADPGRGHAPLESRIRPRPRRRAALPGLLWSRCRRVAHRCVGPRKSGPGPARMAAGAAGHTARFRLRAGYRPRRRHPARCAGRCLRPRSGTCRAHRPARPARFCSWAPPPWKVR